MVQPKMGTAQINVELPAPFLDEFKGFAAGRGEKLRDAIFHAMRRHMKYPPPPPPELATEPLPDSPVCEPEAPAKAPAKRGRKSPGK